MRRPPSDRGARREAAKNRRSAPAKAAKRWGARAAALCGALFLCLLLVTPAAAVTPDDVQRDFAGALPSLTDGDALRDAVGDAEKSGEFLGVEYLFSLLTDALSGQMPAAFSFLLQLIGFLLLAAVFEVLAAETEGGAAARAVSVGQAVILCGLLYRFTAADVERVSACVRDMARFADALAPIYGGLLAAGGSAGTAAGAAAGFAGCSLLLENLCAAVLVPLLRVLFAFALLSVTGDRFRLSGFARTLRGTYLTVLSFLSLLMSASLSAQTALSVSGDSLSLRSVSFAVGNLIPLVGGSVGGAVRTLGASLTLLRSSVGALSVAALLMLFLPVFIGAMLHRLCLSLAASVAEAMGCTQAEKILLSFRGIYDLAVAALAIAAVLFLCLLSLFTKCALALGG